MSAPTGLAQLNVLPARALERALLGCCGSRRWAHRIAAHRPYPDVEALLAAADEACYDLDPVDLAEALARESTLPQLPPAALADRSGPAALTALRAAHAAYEARFGHAFVICLDDTDPGELLDSVLAGIRARWDNEPDEERVIAADELRRIARARLTRLLRDGTA